MLFDWNDRKIDFFRLNLVLTSIIIIINYWIAEYLSRWHDHARATSWTCNVLRFGSRYPQFLPSSWAAGGSFSLRPPLGTLWLLTWRDCLRDSSSIAGHFLRRRQQDRKVPRPGVSSEQSACSHTFYSSQWCSSVCPLARLSPPCEARSLLKCRSIWRNLRSGCLQL